MKSLQILTKGIFQFILCISILISIAQTFELYSVTYCMCRLSNSEADFTFNAEIIPEQIEKLTWRGILCYITDS